MHTAIPPQPPGPHSKRSSKHSHIATPVAPLTLPPPSSHRGLGRFLIVLAVLFVTYTPLLPFDFLRGEAGEHAAGASITRQNGIPTADFLANIAMYVPIGWVVFASARSRMRSGMAAALTIAAGSALSVLMEWAQAYSPTRVSSGADVLANVIGTIFGVFTAATLTDFALERLADIQADWHARPATVAAKGYVLGLAVVAALPFVPAMDVPRMKAQVRAAQLVPFASAAEDLGALSANAADSSATATIRARFLKRFARWAAEFASFVFLAILVGRALRYDHVVTHFTVFAITAWIGCALALGLSVLQFPIVGRGFDITDVLCRLAGVLVGAFAYAIFTAQPSNKAHLGSHTSAALTTGCVLTGAFILWTGLIPFTFASDAAITRVDTILASRAFVASRIDRLAGDLTEKLAMYALFTGLLAAAARARGSRLFTEKHAVMAGIALAGVVETCQWFIPIRFPGIVDVIVATSACVVGVIAEHRFFAFIAAPVDFAPRHQLAGQPFAANTDRTAFLGDQVLASLAEPSAGAPRERSPGLTASTPPAPGTAP